MCGHNWKLHGHNWVPQLVTLITATQWVVHLFKTTGSMLGNDSERKKKEKKREKETSPPSGNDKVTQQEEILVA